MTQTPRLTQIRSSKYTNVSYLVDIKKESVSSGSFGSILLGSSSTIEATIRVVDAMLDDYEYAIITIGYRQVASKVKRYKPRLEDPNNSSVLYRKDLDTLLNTYKTVSSKQSYDDSKPLLLNNLDSKVDDLVGDTGIQTMFRFVKFDGTSDFMLCPGAPLTQLSTTIGLSIFEASSIEEVLDDIILTMSTLLVDNILPSSKLELTPELLVDIQKYLRFSFYGE